jgi:hypothetical protein
MKPILAAILAGTFLASTPVFAADKDDSSGGKSDKSGKKSKGDKKGKDDTKKDDTAKSGGGGW